MSDVTFSCFNFALKDKGTDFSKPFYVEIPLEPVDTGRVVELKNIFFDFNKWDVKIFSIEHNTVVRNDNGIYLKQIRDFLEDKNYIFEENKWDCYFYKKDL